MGTRLTLHPDTPQQRFLDRAVQVLRDNGLVILPTESCYAFVALPQSKAALERVARIKGINVDKKLFSLIVPDLSEIATYAVVSNHAYRILKRFLPGPYTFILPATREVPRILLTKRKTIGLRIPDNEVALEVVRNSGGALLASTVRLPGDELPLGDPDEIEQRLGSRVDLFLDYGWGGFEPTTLVDMVEDQPELVREGAGDASAFLP